MYPTTAISVLTLTSNPPLFPPLPTCLITDGQTIGRSRRIAYIDCASSPSCEARTSNVSTQPRGNRVGWSRLLCARLQIPPVKEILPETDGFVCDVDEQPKPLFYAENMCSRAHFIRHQLISIPDLFDANNLRESRYTLNEVLQDREMVYPIRDTCKFCCICIGTTLVQHSMLSCIVYISQQSHGQRLTPHPFVELFRCLVVAPMLQISANVKMVDPVFEMGCCHSEIERMICLLLWHP